MLASDWLTMLGEKVNTVHHRPCKLNHVSGSFEICRRGRTRVVVVVVVVVAAVIFTGSGDGVVY